MSLMRALGINARGNKRVSAHLAAPEAFVFLLLGGFCGGVFL